MKKSKRDIAQHGLFLPGFLHWSIVGQEVFRLLFRKPGKLLGAIGLTGFGEIIRIIRSNAETEITC
jgi:hypothetical protein